MAKTTDRDDKNIQEIIEGLSRAAHGDLASKIKLTSKDPDLVAIANGVNELIKAMRAVADSARDSYIQLEQINRKLKRIFDASNDIILQVNRYGTCIDINRSVEKLLGYKPDDIKGKHFAKTGAIPEKHIPKLLHSFKTAVEKGEVREVMEIELQAKNGNPVYVEAGTRIIGNGDEVEGAVVVLRDIGPRREAERALREHKDRLHSVITSLEDLTFVLDPDLRFVEYHRPPRHPDPALYAKPAEILGKPLKSVFPGHIAREYEKVIRTCLRKKASQHFELPWRMPGASFWFSLSVSPLLDAAGNVAGVTVVARDTTTQKKMEKTLTESEKKYRKIFDNSPQGFMVLDPEGHIVDINKKLCAWLGYERAEMIGKDHVLYPFLTKSGKVLAMKKFFQRLSGKVVPPYDLEFVTKRGEIFLGEVLAMQLRDEKGAIQQILVMITDVTNRPKS
jgi:PAS domain S-box-containing protein